MKNSVFLAYSVLNSDTRNNINNEIAKYMNNMTKEILERNKRQKRNLENEPNKGEQKIFHLCKNLKLIERN